MERRSEWTTDELLEALARWLDDGTREDAGALARELGARGAVEAIPALVRLVAQSSEDGWPEDAAILALKELGSGVVAPILAEVARIDPGHCAYQGWCEILASAGVRDERIYDALLRLYERNPSFAATCFAEYGDPRALRLMREALDQTVLTGEIMRDRGVLDYEDAIITLGGSLSDHGRSIMERYRSAVRAAERRSTPSTMPVAPQVPRKLGRNAPCWCGSGNKYKRCHWKIDQQG